MIFRELEIPGAVLIVPEPIEDERGFFARTFCADTFAARGMNPAVRQCNVSFNRRKGTVRGMHYQAAPCGETKVVRVTAGAIYDVVVDLRPDSPAYRRWLGVTLDARNRHALYIPEGLAHGFQTLEDDTEVLYLMGSDFSPAHARGVRHDDPAFAIRWPLEISVISEKDRSYEAFRP